MRNLISYHMDPFVIRKRILQFSLVLIFFLASFLSIIMCKKQEWSTLASSLSVVTAIFAIWSSLNITWQQEQNAQPQITIDIDYESHKHAYSLIVKNSGGGPAYNVKLEWVNPILNFQGKAPRYTPYEEDFDFHYIGAGNSHPTFLLSSIKISELFNNSDKPLIYEGFISYSRSINGKYKIRTPFRLSLESLRARLNNKNDQMDFYFENKKMTEYLKKISSSLDILSKDIIQQGRK